MATSDVRITGNVKTVLELFLADLTEPLYGYKIMAETGFPSGKVYQILARLESAGWLIRDRVAPIGAETGGRPRVVYRLDPDAVPVVRRALAEAADLAARGSSIRAHAPRLGPATSLLTTLVRTVGRTA